MSVFFWVITTVYWVIYFPFFVLGCWQATKDPRCKLLKFVEPGKYHAMFIKRYLRVIIIGIALIGGLIYFS